MIKKLIYSVVYCLSVLAIGCTHESEDNFEFSLNQMPIRLSATNPGIKTIEITTNVDWQVTIVDAPWLKIDPMSGTGNCIVTVTAEDNESLEWRSTDVQVKVNNVTKTVAVTQLGASQLLPVAAGAIQGNSYNECPHVDVVLWVDPIEGADSYQWYCDGLRVAETVFPTITVTATTTGSYTYVVAGKNAVGEGTPSPEKRISIVDCGPPENAGAILGDNANTCPSLTVTLTSPVIANSLSYQWYKDGTAIVGATGATYLVTTSGTYNVAGVNLTGEGGLSPDKVVIITTICPFQYTDILGDYRADGIPSFLATAGPSTWNCSITQDGSAVDYYVVSNHANTGNSIYIEVDDDYLYIARQKVGSGSGYDAILTAFYIDGSTLYYINEYEVIWDPVTGTIDCTGTYAGNDVLIGILAVNPSTSAIGGAFGECYANLIYTKLSRGGATMSGTSMFKGEMVNGILPIEGITRTEVVNFDPVKLSRK